MRRKLLRTASNSFAPLLHAGRCMLSATNAEPSTGSVRLGARRAVFSASRSNTTFISFEQSRA
eukprot:2128292-Alexandrium_andersonii.AAC.1